VIYATRYAPIGLPHPMTPTRLKTLDPRTPVIAGVGVATQHVDEPGGGLEAVELMIAATRTAGENTGAAGILRAVQQVAVPHGTWDYADPGRIIAERIGAPAARTVLVQTGIPQQTLLNDAYAAIRAGTRDVALVVGGEAARRAAIARRAGLTLVDTVQDGVTPDDLQIPSDEIITQLEIDGGISSAMAPFALIDSALRHAEGRTLDEQRDEIARLYAGFSKIAATFPHAAFPEPREAQFIREPSAANRPFAFPYNKWHCAQMNVDQAAALLVCSLDAALRFDVDPDRLVFPLVALESSFSLPVSQRRDLHRWPAMEVLGRAAEVHLGRVLSQIELVELYSCFPAAVRVQQRALRLPIDGVPTITGGETFAGGPWNNFVLQTTAAMVERLRAAPDAQGLVTTLSGLLNKPGLAVYGARPAPAPLLLANLAEEAARATPRVEVITGYQGPAQIAAYTVTYDGMTPARCTVIADAPGGEHCVATSDDAAFANRATREEVIGATVAVDATRFTAG
jgi:acetyl-CoA C-acetyltransferase